MMFVAKMVNKDFELQIVNSGINEFIVRILDSNTNRFIANMLMSPETLKNMRNVISQSLGCDCNMECCCDIQEYNPFKTTESTNNLVKEMTMIRIPSENVTVT